MALFNSMISLLVVAFTASIYGIFITDPAQGFDITVNYLDGHDNNSCLENSTFHCKTLDFVLKNMENSTHVLLQQPLENVSYFLKENHTLENLKNIAFIGHNGNDTPVEIKCESEIGLAFHYCEDITFKLLNFSRCGRIQMSAPFDEFNKSEPFYAAIFLAYCMDVVMMNSSIFGSCGKGLVTYDVGGTVKFLGTSFDHNTPPNASDSAVMSIGGGASIHFTQHGGLSPFQSNNQTQLKYDSNNEYYFIDCHFRHNHYIGNNTDAPTQFNYGGALSFFFRGTAQNNSIVFDNCKFLKNSALWGGGIFGSFLDNTQGNYINIKDSLFKNNKARYAGGGVRTGSEINGSKLLGENKIIYEHVVFESNEAIVGGGISHFGWPYLPLNTTDRKRELLLKWVFFYENRATLGSAVGVVLNNNGFGGAIPFWVAFENSVFTNNTIIRTEDKVVVGQGALYSCNAPIILRNVNSFLNNSKTALLLDNSVVKVYGSVDFVDNSGVNGGAIALFDNAARIITTNGSEIWFRNNKASTKGGAIYVRAPGPALAAFKTRQLGLHPCFLTYENDEGESVSLEHLMKWNTKLHFINNSAAPLGGDSLYATTLKSCFRHGEERLKNKALEWDNITYYTSNTAHEISTDPVKINITKTEWEVAAGEVFNASVDLLDEKGNQVYGIVRVNITGDVKLDLPSNLFLVDATNTNWTSSQVRNLKLKGKEGTEFQVEIVNLDGQSVNSKPESMNLSKCNPGFKSVGEDCSCYQPSDSWMEGMAHCDKNGKTVYLKTGYWGGNVNNAFTTIPCPPNYCKEEDQYNSTLGYFEYMSEKMCASNRGGILCGACLKNFSVNIGNENCSPNNDCSYKNWQIPIFIFAIPVIVLVILRINIDIFTSYLNSWLYFYQVLTLLNEGAELDVVMNGIIQICNLQIPGLGSCLFKDFNNLQKTGLNYVVPGSVILCLILVVRIARLKFCRDWYVNRNVFRAMCTLLVLCYTNITTISFKIIHGIPVHGVWILYIDGNILLTETWSATLVVLVVLAAVCILFFVLLLPLLLMCRAFFMHHFPCLKWFDPLIDIFQGCFHTEYGPFAAYYFLCRIVIMIVDIFVLPGPFKRCCLECLTLLILLIFVFIKPYRPETETHQHNYSWLNIVDSVFLTILCVITIMASARTGDAAQLTRDGLDVCIEVLAWLPIVYLVGLIVCGLRSFNCKWQPQQEYQSLEDPSSQHTDPREEARPLSSEGTRTS